MKRHYLFDTGIAQDYQAKRGEVRERAIEKRKLGHRIGICVPVLGELWSGVECSSSRERNYGQLRLALSTLIIWPYSPVAAEEYGRIFAELRRAGRSMQQVDMQIGAQRDRVQTSRHFDAACFRAHGRGEFRCSDTRQFLSRDLNALGCLADNLDFLAHDFLPLASSNSLIRKNRPSNSTTTSP